MRRDLEATRRRLAWYGVRRWHLRLLTVVENALVAVAGAVVGWLVGMVLGALVAQRAGAPVSFVLRESDTRRAPSSRVDVAQASILGGLFSDIAHEHGTTFVCATHDPVLIGFADEDVQLRARSPVGST